MSEEKEIKVRFYLRLAIGEFGHVDGYAFMGFIRGCARSYRIGVDDGTVQQGTKDGFYCVDVIIEERSFERVKGQAASYGVIVKMLDNMGNSEPEKEVLK